jgi:hypothetical protein
MGKLNFFLMLLILSASCTAQYVARVTHLNNKEEIFLQAGEKFYFQELNNKELFFLELTAIEKNHLVFGEKKVSPASLSYLSKKYYRNNFFSSFRRNAIWNLGILRAPSYDFESTHFLEIVSPDLSPQK